MKNRLLSALLVAIPALFTGPAFASGYGPAPFYRPSIGAPASQRGQSAQTILAERSGTYAQASNANRRVIAQTSQPERSLAGQQRNTY